MELSWIASRKDLYINWRTGIFREEITHLTLWVVVDIYIFELFF